MYVGTCITPFARHVQKSKTTKQKIPIKNILAFSQILPNFSDLFFGL